MKVPLADIVPLKRSSRAKTAERKAKRRGAARARGITVHAQPSDEPAAQEINVIGCTVEEATRRVDKFLDEAALAGSRARAHHSWLWHGRASARAWRNFCRRIRWWKRVHPEAEDRGGNAVTVAELKS